MMAAFLAAHPAASVELFVLHDNAAALRLYSNAGFRLERTLPGFCTGEDDLPCVQMIRLPPAEGETLQGE